MKNTFLKYSIITLLLLTYTFSQQERLMWENLVDKKGIKYATGSKNHSPVGSLIIIITKDVN